MRKLILIPIAALALSAPAGAGTNAPLIIAMKDPGCHWFYLGGGSGHRKYVTKLTRRGPVTLLNLDEAALIVNGPGGTKTEPVGAKLTLTAKGTYHITMVKQARHDNHLTLKVN